MFPVGVVVWISITVLPVKIINPKNVHFQQRHAWGYFAFKHFLRSSDDGSLPLVEKICDLMGFRAANRLRVDKVQNASCFSVLPLLPIMKRVTGVKQ